MPINKLPSAIITLSLCTRHPERVSSISIPHQTIESAAHDFCTALEFFLSSPTPQPIRSRVPAKVAAAHPPDPDRQQ